MPPELSKIHRELGITAGYAVERKLAPHPEAAESVLVEIGTNPDGRPVRLTRQAADAWRAMHLTATRKEIALVPISGFRSIARQTEIIRAKLAGGLAIADILRTIAAPGFSEHHTGRALDIATPGHVELDEDFATTAAFRWLRRHAGDFGFRLSYPPNNPHGIVYEPWHWCWHRRT